MVNNHNVDGQQDCPANHRGCQPAPEQNTDPPTIQWLDKLLPAVIQLSMFGGSITFTVVVGKAKGHINNYLALAWLFFTLALGVATFAEMALSFNRKAIIDGFKSPAAQREESCISRFTAWLFFRDPFSISLQILTLLAFTFLSLVVVENSYEVGWIAFACTMLFMALAILIWIWQVCVRKAPRQPRA